MEKKRYVKPNLQTRGTLEKKVALDQELLSRRSEDESTDDLSGQL